jgi:ribosome-binding ATPase YchF (GTP1/OBG family)
MEMCAQLEMEIAQLDGEDKEGFLKDLGLNQSATGRFIRSLYEMLKFISFFTVGPDEVRAWTITRGDPALEAAGKIHSDIQRGFIRAEVIKYPDFIEFGSEKAVKEAGKAPLEGKTTVVQDGDIINFKFNV